MNSDEVVYVCMPCYGQPHPECAKQFWVRPCNPQGKYKNIQRVMDDRGSSLLANAFNLHWASAHNFKRNGMNITKFVMLHNDVVPEDWWLDKLLDDLEQSGADLVSAVIAIKDSRGLTSTAIYDTQDEWEVLKRLTLSEVVKLPNIFTAADCGYPESTLLVNTGCWICDFDAPWVHTTDENGNLKAYFEIHDRIVQQGKEFHTQVYPEDWNFSRKVYKLGGKIAATRNIFISHMGTVPFTNKEAWGSQEYDHALARKFRPQELEPSKV